MRKRIKILFNIDILFLFAVKKGYLIYILYYTIHYKQRSQSINKYKLNDKFYVTERRALKFFGILAYREKVWGAKYANAFRTFPTYVSIGK